MSNARDKANIPALNFSSTGIDDNATGTAITIDSSENVGIGTTSPSTKLHVYSGNSGVTPSVNADELFIENNGAAGITIGSSTSEKGNIFFADSGNALDGYIQYAHDSRYLRFATATLERMRIDSSGNLLVGTTTQVGENATGGLFNPTLSIKGATRDGLIELISSRSDSADAGVGRFQSVFSNNNASHKLVAEIQTETEGTTANQRGGRIKFNTKADGSTGVIERMRITSNGNVGIGTASPADTLNIGAGTKFRATHTGSVYQQIYSSASGNFIYAYGDNLQLFADSGAISLKTIAAQPMIFQTNNTERMRIDSSGNVGIGTSSPGGKLEIEYPGSTQVGFVCDDTTTDANTKAIQFKKNGTEVETITLTTSSTSYNTSSDYRLKENVSYDFDATTRLKQLKPARFNFIADADTTVDGFLAHEVSSIVPEAISGEKDAVDDDGNPKYQGIDQSKLVPLLVKTIQELEARITALETTTP